MLEGHFRKFCFTLCSFLDSRFSDHHHAHLCKNDTNEIQKIYLQKIHGLHELGSQMECNDTLHGSELGPHWVLGQKIQNLVPWDQNFWLKNFFTQSYSGTMALICRVLKPKQFQGLNRLATYRFQILHYQSGKKMKLILCHQKVVYVNGQVKRKKLELFLGQKMMPCGPL